MKLKQKLDLHYKAFDWSQISPDPLQFLHMFSERRDIETIGLLASVFAYGNVRQIINTMNKIINITGGSPYEFITGIDGKNKLQNLEGLKHRFYNGEDIGNLFLALNSFYRKGESLQDIFLTGFKQTDKNIKNGLSAFSAAFLEEFRKINNGREISAGVKFMFPLPELGSACKRMNLFLRWMIRKDELDFGLWDKIPPDKLVIPVDTHVARNCKKLGLTTYKNVSWKMAEQITENLKKFDPGDPVKYDFAICHIGMRKLNF